MFPMIDFWQLHYNETEAKKYTSCSRIQFIQERLAERALELLCLKPDDGAKVILDIGCGSGLSGSKLHSLPFSISGFHLNTQCANPIIPQRYLKRLGIFGWAQISGKKK